MPQVIDLIGQKFGKWNVIQFDGVRNRNAFWLCECECGTRKVLRASLLRYGHTKSCGCAKEVNLAGMQFGELTAIERCPEKGSRSYWRCKCSCGNKSIVLAGNLQRGNTKSCGCKHFVPKHGYSYKPIYGVWCAMIQRCTNPNSIAYHRYGGRGITVCERWMKFEHFLQDMGDRPFEGAEIDRRNNDLGYSKENCRWITRNQQMRNISRNRNITIGEKTQCLVDWSKEYGIDLGTLRKRLRHGLSYLDALTKPVDLNYSRKGC